MNSSEVKKRIAKLTSEINHHRYLYHVLDKQEISDGALDSLKRELEDLEKKYPQFKAADSPSQRVGGKALDKFVKVRHSQRVLSLVDAFSQQDIEDWRDRNEKILGEKIKSYFVELKLDGLTVVLTYQDGVLKKAVTRGDGQVGEDVTSNVKTIESIPLSLRQSKKIKTPKQLEVRAEVIMHKDVFDRLNKQQLKAGLSTFANPRNVAAGSIRQLDPSVAASRQLDCMAFEIISDIGQKSHQEVHYILNELGFKTEPHSEACASLVQVNKFLDKWVDKRKKLNYETDGAVVVVNDIEQEKRLGHVGKAERWMLAYKFPAEQVTTKVLEIEVQVGRTGALTPVAILEPVTVAGSTVSRATLHNQDEIDRLDIRVGDTVIIQKAGDIIPDVVEVIKNLRSGKERKFVFPNVCPSCLSPVIKKEGEVAFYCSNKKCFGQNVEGLIHFVSKKAFNIDGLGDKIVRLFVEKGIVVSPVDIFRLKAGDMEGLEGFADKKISNILQAIENSKVINFSNFIYSLGIRHVGEETSVLLAQNFNHLDKLKKVGLEDLLAIDDIGPEVASSIVAWFRGNGKLLEELLEIGVQIKYPSSKNGKLKGQSFVFTGSMSMDRDRAKQLVRSMGGKVVSSVSKNLDYLVVGEKAGSKLTKARDIKSVKIISEDDFLKLIK